MNYGEKLAYWYLRLNGFFLIEDFVLHGHSTGRGTSDCDLLAIRPRNVTEQIGGTELTFDERFATLWQLDLRAYTLGLIVEVKAGSSSGVANNIALQPAGLTVEVARLGLFKQSLHARIAKDLITQAKYVGKQAAIAKLVISRDPPRTPPSHWLNLTLAEAEDFIVKRLGNFAHTKQPDRMKFHDDLMQYLAWKNGIEQEIPSENG